MVKSIIMSPFVMLFIVILFSTLDASINSSQPIGLPVELRIREILNNKNITDWKDRYLLEKQLFYCSTVSLCGIHALQPYYASACCGNCSCSQDCDDYGTCCPDILSTANDYLKRTACIRPQLRPYHFNSSNYKESYLMVQKCKLDYQNIKIKTLCEKGLTFPNTAEELLTRIPVTSLVTNETYRNKYCALCNGEIIEDLLPWKPNIRCIKPQYIYPRSLAELLDFLKIEIRCNIIFNIPVGIAKHLRKCDWGLITQCNQTGEMDHYDKQLEYFCEHYTSIYYWMYRNIFCYLCNFNMEPKTSGCVRPTIIEPFDMAPFTALIDFRSIESEQQLTIEKKESTDGCKNNQEYDPYKNICLDISCSEGFSYFNGSCKSVYQSEGYKSFEIYFRINPGKVFIPDMHCVANNMHAMMNKSFLALGLRNIHSGIEKSFPGLGLKNKRHKSANTKDVICNEHILADIEMDNITSCNESSHVNFFLIHLELGYNDPHKTEQVIQDVSAIMDIRFTFEKDECRMPEHTIYELQLDEGSYKENTQFGESLQMYIDQTTKKKLKLLFNLRESSMLSCKKSIRLARITRGYLCPSVVLPKNVYPFVYRENQICLADQLVCFNNTECQNNTDDITLCSNTYFSKIPNTSYASCTSEDQNLKIVSLTVSSISMFCLVIVFMVYFRFKELRSTPGKNNLALSANLFIAQMLYQFGSGQTEIQTLCQVLGIAIHFFWLSTILWMNVCTIHMFQVFAKFGTKSIDKEYSTNKRMLRKALYVYGTSASFVLINITVQLIRTSGLDIGYGGCSCYISTKHMLGITFVLPVVLIILTNLILFITVVIKIHNMPDMSDKSQTKHRNTFVIYTKLSCLTGITWVFAFIYQLTLVEPLAYIFIIFNAGQGIFIFLAFICNKRVLNMIKHACICDNHIQKYSNGVESYSNTNKKRNLPEQTTQSTPVSSRSSENNVVKDGDDAKYQSYILEQTRL